MYCPVYLAGHLLYFTVCDCTFIVLYCTRLATYHTVLCDCTLFYVLYFLPGWPPMADFEEGMADSDVALQRHPAGQHD